MNLKSEKLNTLFESNGSLLSYLKHQLHYEILNLLRVCRNEA